MKTMRLIDAENTNLLDAIGRNAFRNRQDIIDLINNQPTVDAVPMVHGRWVHLGGDEWCCSVCGFVITTEGSWDKPTKKYCENCGAKMDMRSTVNNNANKEIG